MVRTNISRSKKIIILVAIIVAAVLCGGAIWYIQSQQSKAYGIPLVINAEGLNTEKGTKIPIRAKGEDVRENPVDASFYGGTTSSDIVLKPGKYTLSVSDSPIAEDGTIYSVDGANTDVTISKDGKVSVGSEITISPIPAEQVTDEEIEKACDAAKGSGIDPSELDSLKKKAQARRDIAVAEKKAAEEKAAAEQAAAEKASEEQAAAEKASEEQAAAEETADSYNGHSYSNDYFYIDVPADWNSSDWSVEQISEYKWDFEYKPNNHPTGGAVIVVAMDNPWSSNNGAVKNLGKLANGQNVYANFAGGGISEVSIGLNSTWANDDEYAKDHGLTDEGETDWNAIWEAREKMKEEQTGGN